MEGYTGSTVRLKRSLRELETKEAQHEVMQTLARGVDPGNFGWYFDYVARNFDSLVKCAVAGRPLDHGFRGLEMQDALKELGYL